MRSLEILSVFKLINHKPKRILDFGYGEGGITNFLHKKGFDIIGLDRTKSNYEDINKIFPDCDFRSYDGLNIPFEENSFDTIILNDVMEHIPYELMEKLIKRLKNIIEPNGIIYISVSNRFSIVESHTQIPFLTWFPRMFWQSIGRIFKNKKGGYDISDIYPYTFKRLKSFSQKHNLQFKDFTSVYVFHKFLKLDYIGSKVLRRCIRFLKKVTFTNLFFQIACKCSEIMCVYVVS